MCVSTEPLPALNSGESSNTVTAATTASKASAPSTSS
ncbi:Uncharacterised protein [Vibrio cholerae]|nr:Uncharacterised protein [Vibrio cholerae]